MIVIEGENTKLSEPSTTLSVGDVIRLHSALDCFSHLFNEVTIRPFLRTESADRSVGQTSLRCVRCFERGAVTILIGRAIYLPTNIVRHDVVVLHEELMDGIFNRQLVRQVVTHGTFEGAI